MPPHFIASMYLPEHMFARCCARRTQQQQQAPSGIDWQPDVRIPRTYAESCREQWAGKETNSNEIDGPVVTCKSSRSRPRGRIAHPRVARTDHLTVASSPCRHIEACSYIRNEWKNCVLKFVFSFSSFCCSNCERDARIFAPSITPHGGNPRTCLRAAFLNQL